MKNNTLQKKDLIFSLFKKGKTTWQTTKKICTIYGENIVNEAYVWKWYAKFKARYFNPDSLKCSKSPTSYNENNIETLATKDTIPEFKTTNLRHYKNSMDVFDIITKPVCSWLTKDLMYITYHNEEWGIPEFDSTRLFEMLCLEGQQSGLSWLTVLKKRDHYRKLFYDFNPHKVAQIQPGDIDKYLCDPGIIRHKSKIEAIVHNANCYIKMENNFENFSHFIWGFVNHSPVINNWKNDSEVPTKTNSSITLSNALKKRGFKFVGPTTCYAFVQACGLVNDHIVNCYIRTEVKN